MQKVFGEKALRLSSRITYGVRSSLRISRDADAYEQSPSAFKYYQHHCTHSSNSHRSLVDHQKALVGTSLLIDPFFHQFSAKAPVNLEPGEKNPRTYPKGTKIEIEKQFWIACLFTSNGYGKNVDPPDSILKATAAALNHLHKQIEHQRETMARYQHSLDKSRRELEDFIDSGVDDPRCKRDYQSEVKGCEDCLQLHLIGDCYSVRINSGLFGVPWEKSAEVLVNGHVDMVVVRPPEEGTGTIAVKQERNVNGVEADNTSALKGEIKSLKAEIEIMKEHMDVMKEEMKGLRNGADNQAPRPSRGTKREASETGLEEERDHETRRTRVKAE
ncbi:MAG: hypothetical protein Q9218_007063 [Villophora microphyllina]